MHADFLELVALRDGAPVDAGLKAHVSGCARCSQELERLSALKRNLSGLPGFDPPAHGLQRLQSALDASADAWSNQRWPSLTAVAVLVLTLTMAAVWAIKVNGGRPSALLSSAASGADKHDVNALMADSQRLEALLRALPPRPPVEQAVTSATIDELQNRIELVDLQLSGDATPATDGEQVQRLWHARVQLLNSLVDVRYAEAAGNVGGSARPLELGVI